MLSCELKQYSSCKWKVIWGTPLVWDGNNQFSVCCRTIWWRKASPGWMIRDRVTDNTGSPVSSQKLPPSHDVVFNVDNDFVMCYIKLYVNGEMWKADCVKMTPCLCTLMSVCSLSESTALPAELSSVSNLLLIMDWQIPNYQFKFHTMTEWRTVSFMIKAYLITTVILYLMLSL